MTAQWSLPGYEALHRLGVGRTGELWRARVVGSREPVALRRFSPGLPSAALDELARVTLLLAALDTPYAVRPRELTVVGEESVLVCELLTGGSLSELRASRPSFEAGEVVTVAVPLAQALAAAHAVGLVHGAVDARSVIFTVDGMPLLSGIGLSGALTAAGGLPQHQQQAAADVRDLARMCRHLLGDIGISPPDSPAFRLAGTLAAAADPGTVTEAAAFAAAVRRASPAAPVIRVADRSWASGTAPVGARPVARRPSRRLLLRTAAGVAVLMSLALAATVGWMSGRAGPEASGHLSAVVRPAAGSHAQVSDWAAVIDGLDARRAQAFATADAAPLTGVYLEGSPPWQRDRASVRALALVKRTVRGVRHVGRRVLRSRTTGRVVTVRVSERLPAAETVDRHGNVLARAKGGPVTVRDLDLVLTPAGWRVAAVRLVAGAQDRIARSAPSSSGWTNR